MKPYLISLAVGVAVGLLYSVVNVKSPAPPTIALVGLLGMLGGENLIPMARSLIAHLAG
ncbi:XapX domain-containing protein [Paraburkholderia acidicola]|uniref:XapX domain-containing protein n=1 Tax=Paraburkholderia acidicola TaxID=1912599 RepID=A0ABV1LS46_9BURK